MTDQPDLPIGAIIMWGGTDNVPGGWLLCDGTVDSQTQYPDLHQAIGSNFGRCADTSQFRVPDLRGRFVRGVDPRPGSGTSPGNDADQQSRVDPTSGTLWTNQGSLVGSYQGDEMRAHTRSYAMFASPPGGLLEGPFLQANASTTGQTGGSETRPVNLYLHFIIKAL